jgi:hypothetical protein
MVVTGDHSAVLNAYVEILKASAGARLIALLPHRRPHASQVFEAVVADDGFTKAQAKMLHELYFLEGRQPNSQKPKPATPGTPRPQPDPQAQYPAAALQNMRAPPGSKI